MFDPKHTVCASKYFNAAEIRKIYALGYKDFGENRVQDLLEKQLELNNLNITWHLIGPLQTNKVKKVINTIEYLHTLDRESLAIEIQKYRKEPLKCFIQINASRESQKNGIFPEKLDEFLEEIKKYDKIIVIGLMTIGVIDDLAQTESVFKKVQALNKTYQFKNLSMGMSNDYELALRYGATHLRIGSLFKGVLS